MGMMIRRNIKSREVDKASLDKNTAIPQTVNEEQQYTKTDINRMSTAELKDLAKSVGFENTEEMTGSDLKKNLIEYYNL
jgi:hypothetical protein